jgi:hypothetical protein
MLITENNTKVFLPPTDKLYITRGDKMKKVIRVKKISKESAEKLISLGYTIVIV